MRMFDTTLTTVTYTLASDKIHTPVKLVVVSDLHSCKYGENQRELIDALDAQSPDAILLAGDICDDKLPPGNAYIFVRAAAEKYPCYYVTGNHEYRRSAFEENIEAFCSYGVKVLAGTWDTLDIQGQRINICGVDDPAADLCETGRPPFDLQLRALKQTASNGCYTVLLAHRPLIAEYLRYHFDLIVCGHLHGGHWRVPGVINGLLTPSHGLFPKYAGGQYSFERTELIVSRGLSRENIWVPRIFNPPELVIVELTAEPG